MSLTELQRRLLQGDPSVWQRWNPEPIDEEQIWQAWRDALARRGTPGSPSTVQVYAHFPYCESSCNFCMYFHRVPREVDRYHEYTDYLVGLVRRVHREMGRVEASNVYFGGGTPSALPVADLGRFLEAFGQVFSVKGEYTFEGHPNSLDTEKIAMLARHGVNKISMGLQSFDQAVLRRVTRRNRNDAELGAIFRAAHDNGLQVDVDLMFGLPEQTLESFYNDVGRLIDLGPDQITLNHFHPVHKLPIAPGEAFEPKSVFTDRFADLVKQRGYLWHPSWTNTSRIVRPGPILQAVGAKRVSRLAARALGLVSMARRMSSSPRLERLKIPALAPLAHRLDRFLKQARPGAPSTTKESNVYSQFNAEPAQVLGLGPASYSHIFGYGAYREVTSLDALGDGKPVYFGTRLSRLDECRRFVLDALSHDTWIDDDDFRLMAGHTASELLDVAGVTEQRLWERSGRRFRFASDLSEEERERIKVRLLPPLPAQENIRRKLVMMPEHAERELVAGHAEQLRPAQLARGWCTAMGIPSQGSKFHGIVVRAIGDDEVDFAAGGKHHPVLTVLVRRPGDPAAAQSSEFAISFRSRETPWTDVERALMQTLMRETRKLK